MLFEMFKGSGVVFSEKCPVAGNAPQAAPQKHLNEDFEVLNQTVCSFNNLPRANMVSECHVNTNHQPSLQNTLQKAGMRWAALSIISKDNDACALNMILHGINSYKESACGSTISNTTTRVLE